MEVDGELAKPPSASQLLSLFQPTSSFWNTVPELPSAVTTVPAEQSSFGRADHPAHTLDVGIRLRHPGRNSAPDQGNSWLMKYILHPKPSEQLQEHTYAMCPGCPTFSIPIPIPKQALEAPVQAPERNGQLEYRPEYYDTREKVGALKSVSCPQILESQWGAACAGKRARNRKCCSLHLGEGADDPTTGIYVVSNCKAAVRQVSAEATN